MITDEVVLQIQLWCFDGPLVRRDGNLLEITLRFGGRECKPLKFLYFSVTQKHV